MRCGEKFSDRSLDLMASCQISFDIWKLALRQRSTGHLQLHHRRHVANIGRVRTCPQYPPMRTAGIHNKWIDVVSDAVEVIQ